MTFPFAVFGAFCSFVRMDNEYPLNRRLCFFGPVQKVIVIGSFDLAWSSRNLIRMGSGVGNGC